MKRNELIYLVYDHGYYVAHMYDKQENRYHTFSFLYYTKKEVLYKLRHEHDCTCAHGTY